MCWKHGIHKQTYYGWRKKYGGLNTSDLRRMRQLEHETTARFLDLRENGLYLHNFMFGAARFELTTPCAQGSFRCAAEQPVCNYLRFKRLWAHC